MPLKENPVMFGGTERTREKSPDLLSWIEVA